MRFSIKDLGERIAPTRWSFHRLFSRIHELASSAHTDTGSVSASGIDTFEHRQESVVTDGTLAAVVHNSGQSVIVAPADGPGPVVVSNSNQQQAVVAVSANAGCIVRIQNDGNGYQSVVISSE